MCVYVFVFVCVYMCVYVFVYVCVRLLVCLCLYVSVFCMYVCVCVCVCMIVCKEKYKQINATMILQISDTEMRTDCHYQSDISPQTRVNMDHCTYIRWKPKNGGARVD